MNARQFCSSTATLQVSGAKALRRWRLTRPAVWMMECMLEGSMMVFG
ncbi:MAG: hypothetical protein AB1371_09740 [Pseudomonadota bacterium]|nr:hypothetical protein [Tepidimonas thermarum]